MRKRLLDVTPEEFEKYYIYKCKQDCEEKKCQFRIGACCLGDILSNENNKTLEMILEEIDSNEVDL